MLYLCLMSNRRVIEGLASAMVGVLMLLGLGLEIRTVRSELMATRALEQTVLHGVAAPAPVTVAHAEPGA